MKEKIELRYVVLDTLGLRIGNVWAEDDEQAEARAVRKYGDRMAAVEVLVSSATGYPVYRCKETRQ